jgi:hypothetical protein
MRCGASVPLNLGPAETLGSGLITMLAAFIVVILLATLVLTDSSSDKHDDRDR